MKEAVAVPVWDIVAVGGLPECDRVRDPLPLHVAGMESEGDGLGDTDPENDKLQDVVLVRVAQHVWLGVPVEL